MAQEHHYAHATTPAGAGSDTVISGAVEIDPSHQFQEAAALGEAPIISINVDDPDAAYDFKGLWRWYVAETDCPSTDNVLWTGYINKVSVSRGDGSGYLFPTGAGRRWQLDLEEVNSLIGFRVISGDDGNRPAETAGERLAWLLGGSDYLTTVNDNGLVDYPDDDMDENDYRGSTAQDVLSDLAVQTGYLYFAFYDKDADDDSRISLFFKPPGNQEYASDITISNFGDADGTAIYAPFEDATIELDPSRVSAGVYLPYSGGAVYEYDYATAYEFAFRDRVAPMAEVKTAAKATALADRFLDENDATSDLITCGIRMASSDVNDVKRGQVLQARFQHFPDPYNDWQWLRVVRKTVITPENRTQKFYDVMLELVPLGVSGGSPSGATDQQQIGVAYSGIPELPTATVPGDLLLAAVAGGSVYAGYFASDIRFIDNPAVPPTSSEVPPFPDHDGWTVLGTATSDYTGMNIGGPSPTSGQVTGWAYRTVAGGEVTTHPVQVSTDLVQGEAGIWLWELDSSVTASYVGKADRTNISNPGHATLPAVTAGHHGLAIFSFTQVDYGNPPYSVTADTGNTIVQSNARTNNPATSPAIVDDGSLKPWECPWVVVVELPEGGTPGVTIQAISAYTSINYCGVVIELTNMGTSTLNPIPYPDNQVLGG